MYSHKTYVAVQIIIYLYTAQTSYLLAILLAALDWLLQYTVIDIFMPELIKNSLLAGEDGGCQSGLWLAQFMQLDMCKSTL